MNNSTLIFLFQFENKWHIVISTIIIMLLLGPFFLRIILSIYTKRMASAKKKLEKIIEERTEEIKRQHNELEEQKRSLEKINDELKKLSIVAQQTDNAVMILDSQGNFEWVNKSFTKLFGYSLEELTKDISINIVGPNTPPHIREYINHCFEKKETVHYEIQLRTKYGRKIWLQNTVTPVLDKYGEIKQFIAIDSDITQLKETKEQLENQNYQINSSIRYAQTIQNAILPTDEQLNKHFETFCIFFPKDIVSGDFYWYGCVYDVISQTNRIYYAVVDCTGHGVPGAFMSLIGNRLINEVILQKKYIEVDSILDVLDIEIKLALKQDSKQNSDGMDICLCEITILDDFQRCVKFSGARRPLMYYQKERNKVERVKGCSGSIGGARLSRQNSEHSKHILYLQKGDILYLSSDGLTDQNSPDRTRFGTERLMLLLNRIGSFKMEEQKHIIEKELRVFKQHEEQRDDITLLGIQL